MTEEARVAGILGDSAEPMGGAATTVDLARLDRIATANAICRDTSLNQRVKFAQQRAIRNTRAQTWGAEHLVAFCALHNVEPVLHATPTTDFFRKRGDAAEAVAAPIRNDLDVAKVREIANDVAQLGDRVLKMQLEQELPGKLADAVAKILDDRVPRRIEIMVGARKPVPVGDERMHRALPEALMHLELGQPVLLVGPAGTGKSYLAEQAAKFIGARKFAYEACSVGMSEGVLTGKLLPLGEGGKFLYAISQYVDCYENGGLFLLDELDAADPNVLLVFNNSLANGSLPLPQRPENPVAYMHKEFRIIAAANTFGTGADRMYVGRSQLDEATLDRFRMGQIEVEYDAALEQFLCPDALLLAKWRDIRAKVYANKLRRVVSTRTLRQAHALRSRAKQSIDYCVEQLVKGWTPDERQKVGLPRDARRDLFTMPSGGGR